MITYDNLFLAIIPKPQTSFCDVSSTVDLTGNWPHFLVAKSDKVSCDLSLFASASFMGKTF